jgi:hypothetical protein
MTSHPGSFHPSNRKEITILECPMDSMYLLHNALRDEAAELEESVQRFEAGDSLQLIRQQFMKWAAALMFHAEQEDQYIMRRFADSLPVRDSHKEHAQVIDRLESVVGVLSEEIGKTKVIARTQRHLFGAVVAARIAQDDHLESEEAFVLPEIQERCDDAGQLGLVRHLFIDREAADPLWVVDWLTPHLTSNEQTLLSNLEKEMAALT